MIFVIAISAFMGMSVGTLIGIVFAGMFTQAKQGDEYLARRARVIDDISTGLVRDFTVVQDDQGAEHLVSRQGDHPAA